MPSAGAAELDSEPLLKDIPIKKYQNPGFGPEIMQVLRDLDGCVYDIAGDRQPNTRVTA